MYPPSHPPDAWRDVVVACTTGTRPHSPHRGMVIYETDTGRRYKRGRRRWHLQQTLEESGAELRRSTRALGAAIWADRKSLLIYVALAWVVMVAIVLITGFDGLR